MEREELFEKEVKDPQHKIINKSWDWHINSDHSIEDIDLKKVGRFIGLANKNRNIEIKDNPRQVLRKFELVRDNKVTNAGFLLFSKDDSALSAIELIRIQDNLIIKERYTLKSDLLSAVELVMDYIKKQINKAFIFTGDIQRVERWDYPLDAVREIVVNSIVHRDYRESSDSIIKIYDTRIEFFNPGKLPEGMNVDVLLSGDYVSHIRNKKIAEIFKEANLIEKYGSGIRRILEGFKVYGLPEPVFEEVGNGFRVTIYKNDSPDIPPKGPKNTPQRSTSTPQKNDDTPQKSSLSQRIIEVLQMDSSLSQRAVAEHLGISFETAKEYFAKLKKQGKIQREGTRKFGTWRVL
jgi:ATP-dependent DNA helicase RecG